MNIPDDSSNGSLNLETLSLNTLVDHRGAMAFIDELVEAGGGTALCRAVVRADNPFLMRGRLPAWILVEYIAQSVAVFAGYIRASRGDEHRHGLLLGCRNLSLTEVALVPGSRLDIEITEIARFERLGSFKGRITCEDAEAASGTLSVYEATEWPVPRTGLDSGSTP